MALERSTMKNFFSAMGSQMMGGFGAGGNIRLRVQRSAIAPNGTIVARFVNTSISPNVEMATFTIEGIS